MKRKLPYWILSAAAALFLSGGLLAQEQVEVSVKVKKDGEVVKDTTYIFDDAGEAKQALKMMDMMNGDDEHMEHIAYNYTTTHSGSGEAKKMIFISEDGEHTEITEFNGDSAIWVSEDEVDGDHVKVIKYKIDEGDDVVRKKEIKVVVSGDEKGNWTVVEGDEKMMDKDENVFIMEGDDEVKVKVMKIMEEDDGENVKVIVITEGDDLHEIHEHDVDVDHDEDVEVKIVKKKVKKEKQ